MWSNSGAVEQIVGRHRQLVRNVVDRRRVNSTVGQRFLIDTMPGGLENPVAGYVAFSAVKFGGYTFAAWRLNRSYSAHTRNVVAVGATRTGIGMVFGTLLTLLLLPLVFTGGPGLFVGYLIFVPVRVLEWWLIILIFYDRQLQTRAKDWRCVGLGTVWSFVLDAPAIIGLVATGGFWIC